MEIFYTVIDKDGFPVECTSDEHTTYLNVVSLNECMIFNSVEEAEIEIHDIEFEWDNGHLWKNEVEFPLRVAKVKNIRQLLEL